MLTAVSVLGVIVIAGGGGTDPDSTPPAELASVDSADSNQVAPVSTASTTTTIATPRMTSTTAVPVELGTPNRPFGDLPPVDSAPAIVTSSGVVTRVLHQGIDRWLVATPCQNQRFVSAGQPLGRAHIVLDAGHGGREPGAVGSTGLTEKDLNLRVVQSTAARLRAAGATVALTRTGDYAMTVAARGQIAAAINPALFVSVHHNGGAPADGGGPGTIVFTKHGNDEAKRFGGLFYDRLGTMLAETADVKRLDHQIYLDALNAHEAQVLAYDQAMQARQNALVANGQLPPEATTIAPTTLAPPAGEAQLPSARPPAPTTTLAPTVETTVPVPPEPTPLPPFLVEPVRPFRWAGSGNAGVRSWSKANGDDFLGVLRHSDDVPAVLAEFLYLTNPSEEELLVDPVFVEREAEVLAETIIEYFSSDAVGSGFVADQFDDQAIGNSGGVDDCVEPELE